MVPGKVIRLPTYSGDEIELFQSGEGLTACPVCGLFIAADPPWYLSWPIDEQGNKVGDRSWAMASFDICPCCDTHYGVDDSVESREKGAQAKCWAELRIAWLEITPLTPELREQLEQIGVVL